MYDIVQRIARRFGIISVTTDDPQLGGFNLKSEHEPHAIVVAYVYAEIFTYTQGMGVNIFLRSVRQ